MRKIAAKPHHQSARRCTGDASSRDLTASVESAARGYPSIEAQLQFVAKSKPFRTAFNAAWLREGRRRKGSLPGIGAKNIINLGMRYCHLLVSTGAWVLVVPAWRGIPQDCIGGTSLHVSPSRLPNHAPCALNTSSKVDSGRTEHLGMIRKVIGRMSQNSQLKGWAVALENSLDQGDYSS